MQTFDSGVRPNQVKRNVKLMDDRAFDAGFQYHRQLPKRQQQGHAGRLRPFRSSLPAIGTYRRKFHQASGVREGSDEYLLAKQLNFS
jgi:hypothetical protein